MIHLKKGHIHRRRLMDNACQTVQNFFPFSFLAKNTWVNLAEMCTFQIVNHKNSFKVLFILKVPCAACEGFPVRDSATQAKWHTETASAGKFGLHWDCWDSCRDANRERRNDNDPSVSQWKSIYPTSSLMDQAPSFPAHQVRFASALPNLSCTLVIRTTT